MLEINHQLIKSRGRHRKYQFQLLGTIRDVMLPDAPIHFSPIIQAKNSPSTGFEGKIIPKYGFFPQTVTPYRNGGKQ